jgi:hypothetical protein
VGKFDYGSQRELLAHLIDPDRRTRINHELLELNVELREFAGGPSAIEWISPDLKTGKELKDAAWSTVGLPAPSPQDKLPPDQER